MKWKELKDYINGSEIEDDAEVFITTGLAKPEDCFSMDDMLIGDIIDGKFYRRLPTYSPPTAICFYNDDIERVKKDGK